MDNRNSGAAGSGLTLSGLVFIVFLVLKLCNVINWSWWWAIAPLWGSAIFYGLIFGIGFLCIWAQDLSNKRRIKKYQKKRREEMDEDEK